MNAGSIQDDFMVTCMEKIVVLPLGTLLSLEDWFLRLRLALNVDA